MFIFVGTTSAQWRKTWDFTAGLSAETQANLIADATNWSISYADDGVSVKEAKDLTKMSGTLKANDVVISELNGLVFGSAGLSKNNNFIVASSKLRVTRKGMEINLPRLAAGQTITFRARSANGSATDRGFKAGNDNLEYISGPDGGLCLGANNEDPNRGEDGNYTLVWKVKDDIEGDSADVKISVITGGLDIASIMIDNGDAPSDKTTNIAYLYDSSYPGYTFDENTDMNYGLISGALQDRIEGLKVNAIDIADANNGVDRDSLLSYNVVVVNNAINAATPYVSTIKSAIAFVPMLNLSTTLYETWGYGTTVNTTTNMMDIPASAQKNSLYQPYDINTPPYIDENSGQITWLASGNICGYTVPAGSYFAKDDTLGTADGVAAVHIHNADRNAYLMIPYNSVEAVGDVFYDMLPNAVEMLNKTKRNVINAAKPVVGQDYHNLYTTVSLTGGTKNSTMYYTLDGSEPTTESTLYETPFDVNSKDVTVKAIATADGYLTSESSEAVIDIFELAKTPVITVNEESGQTTVTITPAEANDVVYYNYTNSNDSAESSKYTEPIVLTKHATITAFAGAHDIYLQSESIAKDVAVINEQVRMDIVSHMDANRVDWNNNSSSTTYYGGKGGYNFYTDDIIDTKTYKAQDGSDSIVFVYAEANILTTVNSGKGWEFKTYGQSGIWQGTGISHNVMDFGGYNPQTAEDDSEKEITGSCISFASVSTTDGNGFTDPASACIQSTVAFQAPFDVVTYVSGKNAKVEVYVTSDTTNVDSWTKIGDVLSNSIEGEASDGKDGTSRIWKKTILPCEGTGMMFVKLASGGNTANIFDIFIKNEGELSKAYITGIEDVNINKEAAGEVIRTIVYSLNGTQIGKVAKGINIIKEVYANGVVKTKKVMVK